MRRVAVQLRRGHDIGAVELEHLVEAAVVVVDREDVGSVANGHRHLQVLERLWLVRRPGKLGGAARRTALGLIVVVAW